jgi:hypothetical protein
MTDVWRTCQNKEGESVETIAYIFTLDNILKRTCLFNCDMVADDNNHLLFLNPLSLDVRQVRVRSRKAKK